MAGGPVHESQFGEFAHALAAEESGWNVRSESFQNCAMNAASFCLEIEKGAEGIRALSLELSFYIKDSKLEGENMPPFRGLLCPLIDRVRENWWRLTP